MGLSNSTRKTVGPGGTRAPLAGEVLTTQAVFAPAQGPCAFAEEGAPDIAARRTRLARARPTAAGLVRGAGCRVAHPATIAPTSKTSAPRRVTSSVAIMDLLLSQTPMANQRRTEKRPGRKEPGSGARTPLPGAVPLGLAHSPSLGLQGDPLRLDALNAIPAASSSRGVVLNRGRRNPRSPRQSLRRGFRRRSHPAVPVRPEAVPPLRRWLRRHESRQDWTGWRPSYDP